MRACRLKIANFRGIKAATLLLPKHGVLIGDNNTGKTTILEALDLVLGADRLNRQPPIDEHDFFCGVYRSPVTSTTASQGGTGSATSESSVDDISEEAQESAGPLIDIEVTVTDLTDEQKALFGDNIEFWDTQSDAFYDTSDPTGVDAEHVAEALRVTFRGWYDEEEDDFEGRTYFTRTLEDGETPVQFTRRQKQVCGFLYLRSHRTGSRALSLERGSLLDIILRVKELRPQMWEATITTLSAMDVAGDPALGISPVLGSISAALKKYVPKEWGVEPRLKVSTLTREHLRKVITAFLATGGGAHIAPFYRQGSGTINMLVLALLSEIAEDKQNVIFAMEEPETAVPPYAQKRIVHEIRKLASQALFTSHSPYVLEEFDLDETVVLARHDQGALNRKEIALPECVKPKRYRQEFRTRFCEGLLARRVLIAEGATEASAFPVACRRLAELKPDVYSSLEALGICTIDAGSQGAIAAMARLYRELGKRAYAICDKQNAATKAAIEAETSVLLMHDQAGFENLVLKGTSADALVRFAKSLEWPPHLASKYPKREEEPEDALKAYFSWAKGSSGAADFLAQCSESEIAPWLRDACLRLRKDSDPTPDPMASGAGEAGAPTVADTADGAQ